MQSGFSISSKFRASFFLTLKVIASSTQFFTIFEHFNIQKRKEKVDINPNLKKQNKDDNFDMKF